MLIELGVTGDSFGSLSLLHSSLGHSLPTVSLTLPQLHQEASLSKTTPTANHKTPPTKKGDHNVHSWFIEILSLLLDLLPSRQVKRRKPTLSAPEAVHFSGRKSRSQYQISSPPPLSPLVSDDIRRSNSKSASTSQVLKVSHDNWMSNEELQKASVYEQWMDE